MNQNLKDITQGEASWVQTKNEKKPVRKWTKTEINFLRQNYRTMTAQQIADELGREKYAVYAKIKAEKWYKRGPYNYKKKRTSGMKTEPVQNVVQLPLKVSAEPKETVKEAGVPVQKLIAESLPANSTEQKENVQPQISEQEEVKVIKVPGTNLHNDFSLAALVSSLTAIVLSLLAIILNIH